MRNNIASKFINNLFSNRIFVVIFSLILSLIIWGIYTNNYGGVESRTFYNVEVDYTGESTIRDSLGLVVSYESTDMVNVTVSGPRRYIRGLTSADLTAVIDLSSITRYGDKTLNYTIQYPNSVDSSVMTVTKKSPEYVTLSISKTATKVIDLKGEFIGSLAEGYVQDKYVNFEPATITVTGPEDKLSEISYAYVVLDRENVSSSFTAESSYVLKNEDGEILEYSDVYADYSTVLATVTVYVTKDVALDVTLIEGGGATNENVIKNISPSYITLAGDSATLAGLNSISLATIDLSKYQSYPEQELSIVIPNNVENLSGETVATVSLDFVGLETKLFSVYNLETVNCAEGYTASIMPENVVVTVRGPEETLASIESNNIRVVADLSGLTVTSRAPASVYVDGYSDAGAVGDYSIWVSLEEAY